MYGVIFINDQWLLYSLVQAYSATLKHFFKKGYKKWRSKGPDFYIPLAWNLSVLKQSIFLTFCLDHFS